MQQINPTLQKKIDNRETELQQAYDTATRRIKEQTDSILILEKQMQRCRTELEKYTDILQRVKLEAERQGFSHIL